MYDELVSFQGITGESLAQVQTFIEIVIILSSSAVCL